MQLERTGNTGLPTRGQENIIKEEVNRQVQEELQRLEKNKLLINGKDDDQ